MEQIKFIIDGEPKGKGRPRFTRGGHAYTPQGTVEYENLVRASYIKAGKVYFSNIPLGMEISAYYKIPKSTSKKKRAELLNSRPMKKPDYDNIAKIITDALNGLAYEDDRFIVEASQHKFYAENDNPRVEVRIYALCEPPDDERDV